MFGDLIQHLHRPDVAAAALALLPDPELARRVEAAAEAAGLDTPDYVAALVCGFMDHADDDRWLQIVGVMGKSPDPGLAALEAILRQAVEHAAAQHAPPTGVPPTGGRRP
ncbi:hypothetical protein [Oceanibaculum indicum]|uniref:Uncharacterized protein n=1 Tax=Oceanibaculum indicum P24 TaxID=1207063 RepID=K2JWI2_9PROT|nr:hypothetical protein [Oceanibaculum indicum]EKE78972.1 hypothetical protein P24_01435 [Oceanibaculum indicum P24]